MKPSFCAACTATTSALVLRGHHWLCAECDPDNHKRLPAASTRGRGYDAPEPSQHIGPIREAFAAGARRVNPNIATEPEGHYVGLQQTPGFISVIVGRKQNGRVLDRQQALETLRGNSWFSELRYLGSDRRSYVFERPDAEAMAAERRRAGEVDVMGGLAELSRGGR